MNRRDFFHPAVLTTGILAGEESKNSKGAVPNTLKKETTVTKTPSSTPKSTGVASKGTDTATKKKETAPKPSSASKKPVETSTKTTEKPVKATEKPNSAQVKQPEKGLDTKKKSFRFLLPIDGSVIHERSGSPLLQTMTSNNGPEVKLRIRISGELPENGSKVELIDVKKPSVKIPVTINRPYFSAEAEVTATETTFSATLLNSGNEKLATAQTRVIWLKSSFPRSLFQVEDAILFLRDLQKKKYKTLFASPFLKKIDEMHKRFNMKIVLNLFYEIDKDFNLSKVPDIYKEEWQNCSNWLKLAFHARSASSVFYYWDKTPKAIQADRELVRKEVLRFAGEESWTDDLLLHGEAVNKDVLKMLTDEGRTTFAISAQAPETKDPKILENQLVSPAIRQYIEKNDVFFDRQKGLLFSRIDLCFEKTPLKDLLPLLYKIYEDRNRWEVMSFTVKERFFWSGEKGYIADLWTRLEKAFRFLLDRNYLSVFPGEDPYNELVKSFRRK